MSQTKLYSSSQIFTSAISISGIKTRNQFFYLLVTDDYVLSQQAICVLVQQHCLSHLDFHYTLLPFITSNIYIFKCLLLQNNNLFLYNLPFASVSTGRQTFGYSAHLPSRDVKVWNCST